MAFLDRREFLKRLSLASLAMSCGGIVLTERSMASMIQYDYYLGQKDRLIKDFRDVLNGASQRMGPELGPERAAKMARDAMSIFKGLIPGFPDVGSERNLISYLIPTAAWYVALYRSMRQYGKTAKDAGKILYDLDEAQFKETPEAQKKMMTERLFSPRYLAMFRDWAVWTQKAEHPANWVAHFVEGRGDDYDYGCDYTECAMVKYVTAQGVPEVAPYICLADFPASRAYNSGLVRTKTVATGDGVCNFRYKKGRPVSQGWSTEIDQIIKTGKG